MNEKELRKLRRQDLLQLLLLQNRETEKLQARIGELSTQNAQLLEDRERMHAWLDEKDARLAALGRLQLAASPEDPTAKTVTITALQQAFERSLQELLEAAPSPEDEPLQTTLPEDPDAPEESADEPAAEETEPEPDPANTGRKPKRRGLFRRKRRSDS